MHPLLHHPSPHVMHPSRRALGRLGRSAWRAFKARLHGAHAGVAQRPASLAVFDVSELPELKRLFGEGAARHTLKLIGRALERIDPARGRIFRTTPTSFAVLLPGHDAETAMAAVRGALGETLSIDSDWHGEEIVVVPDFLIRSSIDSSGCVEQLCAQMLGEIMDNQQCARRRRHYLRLERESHLPTAKVRG